MTRWRPARLVTAVALVAAPLLVGAGSSGQPVFVLSGRGFGHGVGMAQDSARAMAAAGSSREQVLAHFYPGTGRARRSGLVRVAVWEAGASTGAVTVTVPGGARVSGGGRTAQAAPGAQLRITVDGTGYHVRQAGAAAQGIALRAALLAPTPGPLPNLLPSVSPAPRVSPAASPKPASSPSPAAPAPGASHPGASPAPSSAAPSSSAVAGVSLDSSGPVTVTPPDGATTVVAPTGRRYRGDVVAMVRDGFRLVDVLDVEDYLRGLGEVPASWPAAALETQAVAARTYALRAVAAGHPLGYDLCDDTRCQVYLGAQAEAATSTAAARATRGEVITYGGGLADAFYSANAGGVTATPAEGFGSGTTLPYLPGGVPAPGDVAPWRLTVAPRDIAARLGYPGRLDALVVSAKGPSGRVTGLRLDGSAGRRELTGVDVARRLGLRSTLFTVSRTTGAAQALPAPAAAPQLAPAQAAESLFVPPSPAPSAGASSAAKVRAAATTTPAQPLGWGEVAIATFLVVGVFAGVLTRRARLARHALTE